MREREYAVRVIDSAPGQVERIIPVAYRRRGDELVEHYEALDATRSTYGIRAKVVFKYSFMPEMPWEDA